MSISVSPLIRIHNETKFSIELRIRRPEQMEDEFASMSLKAGETFDDSMASFDAINLSGGFKKALMSLNVGTCFWQCYLNLIFFLRLVIYQPHFLY